MICAGYKEGGKDSCKVSLLSLLLTTIQNRIINFLYFSDRYFLELFELFVKQNTTRKKLLLFIYILVTHLLNITLLSSLAPANHALHSLFTVTNLVHIEGRSSTVNT